MRVLLFVCSGGFAASLVLWFAGADWELSRIAPALVLVERQSAALASNIRLSPSRLESITSDTCLNEAVADSILAARDEPVLIGFLAKLPEEFWETHPNANVLGCALGRKWALTVASPSWWPSTKQAFAPIKANANARNRLLLHIVAGALEVAKLAPAQVESLLRQCTPDEAKLVIEAYAATTSFSSPHNALNDLLKLWRNGVHEPIPSERRFLASTALRYHVSRFASVEEFTRYVEFAECGSDFGFTLLEDVAMFSPALYESCLTAFGGKDPRRTAELARKTMISADKLKKLLQGIGDKRYEFLKEYLEQLSLNSPQTAADLAETFLAAELPLSCRAAIVQAMLCLGDGNVDKWLTSLSQKERAEALDAIDWDRAEKMGMKSDLARSYLHHRLTLSDLESIRSGQPRPRHLGEAIRIFARENIGETLSLLGPLPSETREELTALAYHNRTHRLRFDGQMEDCYALIERAPAALVPELLADSLPFEKDLEAAVAAIDRFQLTNEARARVMDGLLSSGMLPVDLQKRQEAILAWIKTSPGMATKSAIEFVIDECVEADPASGVVWISRMPPGAARNYGISTYATKWAGFDPVAASKWIAEMPAGPERDLAAKELVVASIDDLEIAFANAAAISNPKLQFDAASQVVRAWRKIDPRSAFNYLEKSSLPRDVVQRLQAIVPAAFLSIQ